MTSRLNDDIVPTVTLAEGFPVHNPSASVQLRRHGGGGLGLLQDTQLIESLAHFARERIPERVVHAKAAGAWGEFEVTHDVSKLTSAKFLEQVGKKTPVFARLSTVAGERGAADTLADIRGFAVKFYTEEGNYDIVGNDLPVFFIRDPVKFPSLNRSHKRHPQTNAADNNMFWDFHNNAPESIHTLMQLFGGRGTPQSLRHVNGFANHTFKFGHPNGDFVYVKIHFKPPGGVKNMDPEEAMRLAGVNPDYHVLDLYNAIQEGDFPTWIMYIQVMTPQQAEQAGPIVFDITKVWPHKDYPLQQVGKLTLNKNPENYFAEVEQAAFSPSTLVPGISPSPDIMLHARMFSYPDAQRYRVGPNYQQLPVNTPRCPVYAPYQRDGAATVNKNYGGDPVYVGSRFRSIVPGPKDMRHEEWAGRVQDYASEFDPVEDVRQPRELWTLMKKNGDDVRLVNNLAGHIGRAVPELQQGAIEMFSLVDKELSDRIAHRIKEQGTGKS